MPAPPEAKLTPLMKSADGWKNGGINGRLAYSAVSTVTKRRSQHDLGNDSEKNYINTSGLCTYEINDYSAFTEAASGVIEEAILAIWLVVCSVFRDGVDVIVVAGIDSWVSEDEEGAGLLRWLSPCPSTKYWWYYGYGGDPVAKFWNQARH